MRKNKYQLFLLPLILSLLPTAALAASARMSHRFGVWAGLDDPYPAVLGANAGYSATDFLMVEAGIGGSSTANTKLSTIDGGVRFYVPDWNLSPTVILGLAAFNATTGSIRGHTGSNLDLYLQIGLDWHAASGFFAGVGFAYLDLGFFF